MFVDKAQFCFWLGDMVKKGFSQFFSLICLSAFLTCFCFLFFRYFCLFSVENI